MVSAPSYDPNLLTGRAFSKNYQALALNVSKPLFNRASQSMYRPGSTFKLVHTLIAMQEGILTPETSIACHTSPMHCHPHPSPQKLMGGVIYSCNSYFFHVFKRIVNRGESSSPFIDIRYGMAKWSAYVDKFGYGTKLGVDIPNEKRGKVPTIAMYDKVYGERRWKFSTIYSISIGEGEYSVNPIQLANFVSCIANKGYWITPHFVQKIGDKGTLPAQYAQRHETGIAPEHYEYLHDCMEQVILAGMTVWKRGVVMDSVVICGKTGTSQNAKGKDHSIFIGFAPKENPKIAIACLVENAGFGGYAAAPIASLMIERFIKRRTIRKNLKQFMTDKEYLTPIERAVRRAQHLQDSLRRMEDSSNRVVSNRIVALSHR
jgi:penicillin-binding protein 2